MTGKTKFWMGFGLMFVSGLVIGAVLGGAFVRHRVQAMIRQGPPELGVLITEKLKRDLNLDPSQERSVAAIGRDLDAELQGFRAAAEPKVRDAFESTHDQIRGVLRPDQKDAFDAVSRTFPLWPAAFLDSSPTGEAKNSSP
jgi:hypothetical protein